MLEADDGNLASEMLIGWRGNGRLRVTEDVLQLQWATESPNPPA
jgi:hypothetical protein